MGDKYDVMFADTAEQYLVVVCLSCGSALTEPLLVLTANKFDEVTAEHNKETCKPND